MSITKQIGWSPEDNLLADISKQMDRLIQVASTISGGGGGGTVTSFSFTNGGGFIGTVTYPTTTPTLSLVLQNASGSQSGQLTSSDWTTFNNKQSALSFANLTGTTNQVSLSASGTGVLVGSTNITLSIPANAQLSVAKLTNLTSNGFVKTSGGDGTLSIDTNTYITTGSAWLLVSGGTLTGANTITGTTSNTLTFIFNSLGVTQTNGAGAWFQNSTAATNGNQQISPLITLEGQGFGTGANTSQSVKYGIDVLPVQAATNPSATWRLRASINGAAYSDQMTFNTTTGILGVTAGVNGSGSVLTLSVSGTERTRITTAGDFLIGSTSDQARLYVVQAALASGWIPVLRTDIGTHSMTAGTAYNGIVNSTVTLTWANGSSTIATQSLLWYKSPTYNAGTGNTITDAVNAQFDDPIAGTGTVSNVYSILAGKIKASALTFSNTSINTTAGDSATINASAGRFRKDNSGSTFTLTNSFITANSIILLTWQTVALTGGTKIVVVAGSGSATITFEDPTTGVATAPSANADINFLVIN